MPSRQAEPQGAAYASPSAPVLERRRIVASKLSAPPLRPGIVERPVLLDGLTSATHAPVVLVYTGSTGEVIIEPGPIELSVGCSSDDIRSTATFTVTGKTRDINGEERAFLSTAEVSA